MKTKLRNKSVQIELKDVSDHSLNGFYAISDRVKSSLNRGHKVDLTVYSQVSASWFDQHVNLTIKIREIA